MFNKNYIKSQVSKINFLLGNNPKFERINNWRRYIPHPYKSVITITADFELAWAWRYSKSVNNPLTLAIDKAKIERKNIPQILELCETYNIPVSWATVGHLFLEHCKCEKGKAHANLIRPYNFESTYWNFNGPDWFEYDPCSNYIQAPEWYAPDLIEQILNSKVKHEIGCHTFSHIDCSDEVCPTTLFEAEVNECIKEASKIGLKLKSFVHPGHTIGNLNKLAELEFTSFQSDPGNILGYPAKHNSGVWELKRTYEFTYRKEWSIDYHIYRYKKIIDRAIKNNAVCNFWFHPSFDKVFLDEVLPKIFKYLDQKRDEILVTNVWDYIKFLNKYE